MSPTTFSLITHTPHSIFKTMYMGWKCKQYFSKTFFFGFLLFMLALISDVTINKTMQNHICVKSCNGNLISPHASLASGVVFAHSISFSLSTNTHVPLTIRGSQSAIWIYNRGVKVCYTPQHWGSSVANNTSKRILA